MENKYYTPEIEEFHVGFEYEHGQIDGTWTNAVLQGKNFNTIEYLKLDNIRVKHLDREDIEGEGWSYTRRHNDIYDEYYYTDGEHGDYYFRVHNGKSVHNAPWFSLGECHIQQDLFRGDIKNLSEFRRILKQIGI